MQILDCEIKVVELVHPVGYKKFRAIAYEFFVDGQRVELSISEILAETINEAQRLMELEIESLADQYGYFYRH